MSSVTVRVPAKVNLHLAVGTRRADGYHELSTVYQAVSLYDEVSVEPAEEFTVTVHGDGATEVPGDGRNLALRAAQALAAHTGTDAAVRVTIRKGIPVAGGMAGGSADAAAALLGCDALWGTGLSRAELDRLAAALGSDVPFCLHGGTAMGTGRGERLSAVLAQGSYPWVFALAEGGLSTPAVYARLDELRDRGAAPPAAGSSDGVLAALRAADVVALGQALANDLTAPALALRPHLRRLLDAGRELGAVGAVLCGSGPTVAFLMRSAEDAVTLAASLAGEGLCRGLRQATGPVPGAQVVADAPSLRPSSGQLFPRG